MNFFHIFIKIALVFSIYPMLESAPLSINTDKEALLSFKSQISTQFSNNPLTSWDKNSSPCNWTGISCNGERVIAVDLSGYGITGSISPYLGNISLLRSLELQNNQLTGKIPYQIGNLYLLRSLNLSFNSIEGDIPSNISQCKELRYLDLMQNRISGNIPQQISNLTHLHVLNLARNQLSGDFPSFLTNISSLVDLNLGTNNLRGSIPSHLARLVNLKFLDLNINNLSGFVPMSIYNMSSLVQLAFASNNLWGEIPRDIGFTLPNLLAINICQNNISGTIPWSLHNLTNIETIGMAINRLHGIIPPGLENLPNLEMYNIAYNNIGSSGEKGLHFLELLSNSTRLEFLGIHSNLLEGIIPNSIGNLSKVLTVFSMGENNIYGTIPSSIGELRALGLLSLTHTFVSGEIPREIGQLNELRVLELTNNRLFGRIPDSIGNLENLTKIDLSKNQLVGNIPTSFWNLQALIYMDLSHNMLSGNIPRDIINLYGLSAFLNLSHNHLTGPIPAEIGSLQNVAIINISDNYLSGRIPLSIGDCGSLEQLSLARNMLSGLIPNTLGYLKGLETLDLSSNQLSGAIPFELQNLQSLQLLNLSFNDLEGEIPIRGVFNYSSKVHLENNEKLCTNSSCKINPSRGKRLVFVYIIISLAIIASLCCIIGIIYYTRKRKRMIKDSFQSSTGQPKMISYDVLRVATNDFNNENLIGQGSFGFVYKGFLDGKFIAVKVLNTKVAKSEKTFLSECVCLRYVRHRNLIKLVTICSSLDSKNEEFFALIFEFMINGSLDDWISGKRRLADGKGFSCFDRVRYAIGIASAIDYLHNETQVPIVHCDLKPSNILMDSNMTPKVADFGLAKLLIDGNNYQFSTNTLRGSIGYIPPEYGYGEKPSTAGDVYSYGILLLELFTGLSPTHEIFTGRLSLRNWVQNQYPDNIEHVLDLKLQMNNSFGDDKDQCDKSKSQRDCLVTILGVALSCVADSGHDRITIRDALHKLKSVEVVLERLEFVVDSSKY